MLKVSGLCKHFGDLVVLDNFNLTVPRRGFTILIGPSGCGKSTLFNVLTGVSPRESGEIYWLEKSLPHLGKEAAYMQQKDLLLPWFTLLDNALLPATIAGSDMTTSNTKAQRLFKRLGLKGFENYLPAETSGGMRQRCALVRTLMFEHELVLLDEPLSALDAITRTSLQSLLLLLQSEFNKSILMITHNIDEAVYLSCEIVGLSKRPGKILLSLPVDMAFPRDVTSDEFNRYRRDIISFLNRENQ